MPFPRAFAGAPSLRFSARVGLALAFKVPDPSVLRVRLRVKLLTRALPHPCAKRASLSQLFKGSELSNPFFALRGRLCLWPSSLSLDAAFAFGRHPEERSGEERFSIARLWRDESLFMRQFKQHHRNASRLSGIGASEPVRAFGSSSRHGFIRAAKSDGAQRLPLAAPFPRVFYPLTRDLSSCPTNSEARPCGNGAFVKLRREHL